MRCCGATSSSSGWAPSSSPSRASRRSTPPGRPSVSRDRDPPPPARGLGLALPHGGGRRPLPRPRDGDCPAPLPLAGEREPPPGGGLRRRVGADRPAVLRSPLLLGPPLGDLALSLQRGLVHGLESGTHEPRPLGAGPRAGRGPAPRRPAERRPDPRPSRHLLRERARRSHLAGGRPLSGGEGRQAARAGRGPRAVARRGADGGTGRRGEAPIRPNPRLSPVPGKGRRARREPDPRTPRRAARERAAAESRGRPALAGGEMSGREGRPDPDAVLERVRAEEAHGLRGRLRIFLGYSPGVGKTYRMLEGARALRAEGVDVAVGFVETHGRSDTAALLEGLEILPRRVVEHRGTRLEEFDLEAALARKPSVLILDELAHTNAPGGRHEKRWQDALDLLEAGIEVHTTLNVQHLESLNDFVAQITWVRVRETVPDALLNRAEEIELVDLSPEELLERLAQGKVYLPEEAARAKENFFRRGNLLALRELALRRAAERVDAEVRAYRRLHEIRTTWPASERILVCVGPSPSSGRLVRTAYRMAAGLRAPWVAAYVEAVHREPISRASREHLEATLRLAESLGGSVARLPGGEVAEALLRYAREHNVTRIVVGKPTHPRLRDRLGGSLLDAIVRGSGEIDVHVISGDPGAPEEDREDREAPREGFGSYAWATLLVAAATGLGVLARSRLALPDLAMVYLLAIMVAAVLFGRGPSLLASALSVAAYDFFFVPPYFTFAVTDPGHLLTFAMMFVVGFLISELTLRLRRGARHALAREEHTATLYALSRELGAALDEEQVSRVVVQKAAEVFDGNA